MPLPCDQARLRLSDLLAGALAPDDADGLDTHLADCAECREHAHAYCRLDRALGELAAQAELPQVASAIAAALAAEPRAEPARAPAQRSLAPARWLLVAAVLLLAVAVAFWLIRPTASPVVARVERVAGEVYIVSGQTTQPAQAGGAVRSGQGLRTVGEESGAVLVYADDTRLEIGPDSTLGELTDGTRSGTAGKRVVLLDGALSADVAKQADGQPLVLMTPHARVVLQDTRLSLVNSQEATRVDLEKGSAQLTRRSDGESVALSPGTFSIARSLTESLASLPMPTQFSRPRDSLPASLQRIWALTFAPDGRLLVTGGSQGQVRLWQVEAGADQEPVALDNTLHADVRAFAFSRDGKLLAAGGDQPPLTRVWDWAARKEVASLPGHRTWIEALAFSKDGKTLVVAGAHGQESSQIRLWDLERRQTRAVLDGHVGGVWSVVFSPDGQTLASAGRDGVIKLWDFSREQVRQLLLGHASEVYALAFSPDGSQLVSSSRDRTVRLWDTATGHELRCLLGHSREVRAVAFAPDGRTVASASQDGTARWWRVADGQELATFKLPGSANAVAYSPDGRTLAAAGWYKTVQLWDLPAE
ncbi:MAG: FecR domain-containing protein [Planctomycetia bacterium]|nr:FecR domain-containing protein [Planctomycetia bacterium]